MHNLTKEYKEELKKYKDFKLKVEVLIREFLVQNKINYHKIESRIKSIKRLDEKIYRKNEKYNNLYEITDLVGLRIISYLENEVDRIADIIKKEFVIDPVNSIDKRKLDSDRFGYKSLHYVVSLNDERKKLIEYSRFKDLKVEIQIRSILQHAWAEIEHDIGYKSENSIPDSYKRNFYRVAALLETADIEFVNIKQGLESYERSIQNTIKNHPENVEINSVSLNAFINSSNVINYIDKAIAKNANLELIDDQDFMNVESDISRLDFVNINTIKELETKLKIEKENVISFAKDWVGTYRSGGKFAKGISIFYLCYLLIGKSENVEFANEYYEKLINNKASKPIGNKIVETYKKIK